MESGSLLIFLFVGLVAGWLAGKVVQGGGFGLIGNIIVGVIGAFFAGWLLPQLGFSVGSGVISSIVNAFIGAAILLFIIKIIKRV